VLSGLIAPLIIGTFFFVFSEGHPSLSEYFTRLAKANIVTHIVSLCVFPNIILFLIFNRFDMLRALRGVLAITIIWAAVVFGIKFLG
jgi:hypothetical protein